MISTRFDIAGKAPEGITDRRWIRKNVMGLTDREIDRIEEGKVADKEEDLALEAIPAPEAAGGEEGGGGEEAAGGEEGHPTEGRRRPAEVRQSGRCRHQ